MGQVTSYEISASPLNMAGLATELENMFAAAVTANKGATAPSNPLDGMFWWDTSGTPDEVLKRYISTGWVSLVTVNVSTGAVSFQSMDLSTYLAKSTYSANSILAAVVSATPGAVTVAEQTLVGRITGGNITALSVAQVLTLLDIANTYVAKSLFDANSILVANSDNTPAALAVAEARIIGRATGGNIAALTGAQAAAIIGSTGGGGGQLYASYYGSSSTFTFPAGITTATRFKFTITGGGAGAYWGASNYSVGGGAGGTAVVILSGFTAGQYISITVGAGGSQNIGSGHGGASSISSGSASIGTYYATGGYNSGTPGVGANGNILNIYGGAGRGIGSYTNGLIGGSSIYGGPAPAIGGGGSYNDTDANYRDGAAGMVCIEWTQ